MADTVSKETRSRMMSGIGSKDTSPELDVRRFLHKFGFRFRLHRKDLPGNPDIVLPKYNTVIFVHGCFWHQHSECRDGTMPKSNNAYWREKLARNVSRDKESRDSLAEAGWKVVVIWECEVDSSALMGLIGKILSDSTS